MHEYNFRCFFISIRCLSGLKIVDMTEPAELDGGDVLFTGRELFVGLSSRTNKEGVECLEKAFPKYPVTAIDMGEAGIYSISLFWSLNLSIS